MRRMDWGVFSDYLADILGEEQTWDLNPGLPDAATTPNGYHSLLLSTATYRGFF